MPSSEKDTEITLGAGRMLALFFVFVLVCAVFFAIGFSLGRKTTMALAGEGASGPITAVSSVTRPSAGKDTSAKPASLADPSADKSAGLNAPSTAAAMPDAQGQTSSTGPASAPATASAVAGPSGSAPPNSPANGAAPVAGSYFVQVAAVSRQEDADSLVEALKKKQYPAFALNNPSADKFFHVQVGPYADIKEADAMRTRLIADGYNPIVKK